MVIYLDFNSTTPVAEEVQTTIISIMKNVWGNPSSSHDTGREAKSVIEDSRRKVAEMIGSAPHEIVFTSGGTESNYMAIRSAVKNFRLENQCDGSAALSEKPHIITTNIEHDSVKLPLEKMLALGEIEVSFIPVSKTHGSVSVSDVINAIKPNTCLISIMLANNETGIIQPISKLKSELVSVRNGKVKRKHAIMLHTDAAQALGKIEVDVDDLGVDYLTIVGHKLYGPRIGALYCRQDKPLFPIFYGGGQEKQLRPGTENTCMIAGLGKAAELVTLNLNKYSAHMLNMRQQFEKILNESFLQNIVFHVPEEVKRLPNTLSVAFTFPFLTGESLLQEAKEICASTGSCCHSGEKCSQVLLNSGVSFILATKTVRFSVGRETTSEELEEAVMQLFKAVRRLRRQ